MILGVCFLLGTLSSAMIIKNGIDESMKRAAVMNGCMIGSIQNGYDVADCDDAVYGSN